MFKRVTIVALVVAAFLVLAVPALAFNGMRDDYTVATSCQGCHTTGNFGAPKVFDAWAETKHARERGVCRGRRTASRQAPSARAATPPTSIRPR